MTDDGRIENHPKLKSIVAPVLGFPGVNHLARVLVRDAIQRWPLSLKTRQQINNFFVPEVTPKGLTDCTVQLPTGAKLHLQLDMQDDLSRTWYFWGYSGYEAGMVELLVRLLKDKTKMVVEVGANIGYYTLLMAALLENRGTIHAFEPRPEVAEYLRRNAERNNLRNVRLNQVALTSEDGVAKLFIPANRAWTNASLIKGFTIQAEAISVPTSRLDTYFGENPRSRVDLIKLDAEGTEISVLEGSGDLLANQLPDIIVEVLPPYEMQLEAFFQSLPYRKFMISHDGLLEVEHLTAHPIHRDYYLTCNLAEIDGQI